jgi:hypothetical protein
VTEAAVTLPHGVWRGGELRRDAVLRSLDGADEAAFAETARLAPAARTTALLDRCLVSLGGPRVSADDVRGLTAGDREALLLHLRRLTLGERLECLVPCAACGEPIAVELDVADLLVGPYGEPAERHELQVSEDGRVYALGFRLPTGGDQEAAAAIAATDLDGAVELLLQRCVRETVSHPVPPSLVSPIGEAMRARDPQAEVLLELDCPACDERLSVLLDAADFLFRELAPRDGAVFHEVHALASQYGWSEAEILALPAERRRRYLNLIDGEGGAAAP